MSPHRDQEGVAIRHAVYAPVCTCGWRGFSGCVVHPSLSGGVADNAAGVHPGHVRGTPAESDEQEPRP